MQTMMGQRRSWGPVLEKMRRQHLVIKAKLQPLLVASKVVRLMGGHSLVQGHRCVVLLLLVRLLLRRRRRRRRRLLRCRRRRSPRHHHWRLFGAACCGNRQKCLLLLLVVVLLLQLLLLLPEIGVGTVAVPRGGRVLPEVSPDPTAIRGPPRGVGAGLGILHVATLRALLLHCHRVSCETDRPGVSLGWGVCV